MGEIFNIWEESFIEWTHTADLWFVEETKHWNLLEEGSEDKDI